MVKAKTNQELTKMRKAGIIVALAHRAASAAMPVSYTHLDVYKRQPNRSANIALLNYADGEKRYIIAPKGLTVGMNIISGEGADIKVGNAMELKDIPEGTFIHNIELRPGKGGQLARSAGASAQILGVEEKYTTVRLASGEVRRILSNCRATIGQVGNEDHSLVNYGKAGRMRWKGVRPTVRGSVMNPNDHPHGGGEGRTPVCLLYTSRCV